MQDKSYPDKKKMCHRTGFAKSCRDLQDEGICQGRWQHVTGRNVNTDEPIDVHGCVDDLQHLLQMSFEHRLMGIQAAVESRGNEQIKATTQVAQAVIAGIKVQQQQHNEAIESVLSGRKQIPLTASDDDTRQLSFLE